MIAADFGPDFCPMKRPLKVHSPGPGGKQFLVNTGRRILTSTKWAGPGPPRSHRGAEIIFHFFL